MDSKQQAKEMFFSDAYTKKQIADKVGVDERTIYRWIKQDQWQTLKQAALAAPAVMVNHLCSQMVELQNNIAAREEGSRIPTMQEMELTRKLINCIDKLGTINALGANMQMMMNFSAYTFKSDLEFTKKMVKYADQYMFDKADLRYMPYHFLHGAEHSSPTNVDDEMEEGQGHVAPSSPPVRPVPAASPMPENEIEDDLLNNPCLPTWAHVDHNFPPSLNNGVIWQGNGQVFTYSNDEPRKMTREEAIQFARIGYNVEWEKYHAPAVKEVAPAGKMSENNFVSHAGTQIQTSAETLTQQSSSAIGTPTPTTPQHDISRHPHENPTPPKRNPPPSRLIKKGQVYSRPVIIKSDGYRQ